MLYTQLNSLIWNIESDLGVGGYDKWRLRQINVLLMGEQIFTINIVVYAMYSALIDIFVVICSCSTQ